METAPIHAAPAGSDSVRNGSGRGMENPVKVCFAAVSAWLRKEALLKKGIVFHILICFVVLAVCVRPLQLNAQSGSSTCQVTATAGETEPPPSGDTGSGEEDPEKPGITAEPEAGPTEEPGVGPSEEPEPGEAAPEEGKEMEPGETEAPPIPEGGKTPGSGEGNGPAGDSEKETPEPEGTSIPGEDTARPDTGGDIPGEETEPVQTGEPLPGEHPGKHDGYDGFIHWLLFWLLILSIFAALLAGGAFRWLWQLLRFLFFRRSRIRFHGILTNEKSFFIRVRNAEAGSGLVQGMIDSAGSLAEFRKEVQKETAVTFIPGQSRMCISCTGRNGRKRAREMAAGERRMFRVLERLEGTGEVEVRITCRGTGINIPLVFRV